MKLTESNMVRGLLAVLLLATLALLGGCGNSDDPMVVAGEVLAEASPEQLLELFQMEDDCDRLNLGGDGVTWYQACLSEAEAGDTSGCAAGGRTMVVRDPGVVYQMKCTGGPFEHSLLDLFVENIGGGEAGSCSSGGFAYINTTSGDSWEAACIGESVCAGDDEDSQVLNVPEHCGDEPESSTSELSGHDDPSEGCEQTSIDSAPAGVSLDVCADQVTVNITSPIWGGADTKLPEADYSKRRDDLGQAFAG